MNISISVPTKHQLAVLASSAVIAASAAISALAFAGVLTSDQVKDATADVNRIVDDLKDLYGAIAGLVVIAMAAYSTVKSGPIGSFFRAAVAINADPKLVAKVQSASLAQKAPVVAITDALPEVAGVPTTNTDAGLALAASVPSRTVTIAAAAKLLLIAFLPLAALAKAAPAQAQGKVPPKASTCLIPLDPLKLCGALTGNPVTDMQRVVDRIKAATKADLSYAMAKAAAAGTPASKIRLQCLQAIAAANDQINGAGIKDANGAVIPRPDPAVITSIEDIAELVDNLSPQGALLTSCEGAAGLFKTNALAAVNGLVTGAVGLATASAAGL